MPARLRLVEPPPEPLEPPPRERELVRAAKVAGWCALGCVALAIAAAARCPAARADEPRHPPPDVPALLDHLDDLGARLLVDRARVRELQAVVLVDLVARLHFPSTHAPARPQSSARGAAVVLEAAAAPRGPR